MGRKPRYYALITPKYFSIEFRIRQLIHSIQICFVSISSGLQNLNKQKKNIIKVPT